MPPRFLRLLLAFALALAIPLQGFAAVSAGICMTLGHHDSPAAHSHDGPADGEHQHQHSHDDAPSPNSAAHCAPCVACCAAAAISSSAPVVIPDERADPVNVSLPPAFSGIQPETLDRPPLAL
jgi:hypothetical protein